MIFYDDGFLSDVLAEIFDENDDMFAKEGFWEADSGTSFFADSLLDIFTAFFRLFKTFTTSDSELA